MERITDKELREFCKWYKNHFRKDSDVESVFVTCMCGHFHSYPKAMKDVMKRMQALRLITINKEKITIV